MKKHNTVKVVLITMLVFFLLSWILPAAYYSGEYQEQGRVQMGLFDMFNYPLTALSYFGYIAFFFILVGGFYGVLYKIPAYRTLLDKIVERAAGKEKVVLSIMVVVIALLVSICGLQIGMALLIPFIVAIILLMGYDKMVAAMVIVGSIGAGLIGSTFAYGNLSVLLESFNLKLDYQLGVRFILLLVGIILVIFNTLMYIKNSMDVKIEKKTIKKAKDLEEKIEDKVVTKKEPAKKTTKKSTTKTNSSKKNAKSSNSKKSRRSDNKAALKDEDIIVVRDAVDDDYLIPEAVSTNKKTGVLSLLLSLLFINFVLAFITWGDKGFGIKFFDDITKGFTKFSIFKFPIFGKLFGTVNSFGNWTVTDMILPMTFVLLLLIIIYKVSFEDAYEGFVKGAKKALLPAVLVVLIYSILVLVTYHPFQTVIYKTVLGWTKGFNIATTVIAAILASLFNSDISYSFQSVIPYYASVVTNTENFSLAGIIFQSMYGLTAIVAPTSLVLLGTLAYLGIDYKEWLKNIWKLVLELFIILLLVFIILSLV